DNNRLKSHYSVQWRTLLKPLIATELRQAAGVTLGHSICPMPGLQHRWEEEEGEEEEEKEEEGCILRSMPSDPHACLLSGPPLVNSSSCAMGNKTTEIRVKYENILSYDINELVNMSAEYRDRCCKNKKHENTKMFFCNDTQPPVVNPTFALP
ncbi:hypothetical protein Q9233_007711, partial [Columba guinea]